MFFCLQRNACFIVMLLSFFALLSWSTAALLKCLFKICSYVLTSKTILLPCYFLSASTVLDLFLCCWIYLFFGFVQAKTLSQVIALLTVVVILFILRGFKFRLCFAVGKKKENTDLQFLFFFRQSPALPLPTTINTATLYFSSKNC